MMDEIKKKLKRFICRIIIEDKFKRDMQIGQERYKIACKMYK